MSKKVHKAFLARVLDLLRGKTVNISKIGDGTTLEPTDYDSLPPNLRKIAPPYLYVSPKRRLSCH